MGRIKSTMIKKTAKLLLEGENRFNDSFEHDKKVLGSSMPSKPMRNKIAGYLARIKKAEAKPRKIAQKVSEEKEDEEEQYNKY